MTPEPKDLVIFRAAKPYLDRLFASWRVVNARADNVFVRAEYLEIEGDNLIMSLRRNRDGDDVEFYTFGSKSQEDSMSVLEFQKSLGETLGPGLVEHQLRWLQTHIALWRHWRTEQTFNKLCSIRRRADDLSGQFIEMYWFKGADGPDPMTIDYSPAFDKRRVRSLGSRSGDPVKIVIARASVLLRAILGPEWDAQTGAGDKIRADIFVSGPRLSIRLLATDTGEKVLVSKALSKVNDRQIDVDRISSLFLDDRTGNTFEDKLLLVLKNLGFFHRTFESSLDGKVLSILDKIEKANAEFRQLALDIGS